MPFDATTGRVYAPVSVDDVRMALGLSPDEPGAGDVGYLCSHDKINPYSLIRPLYFYDSAGDSPDIGPEAFANDALDVHYCLPAAKAAEVNGTFKSSALNVSDFTFDTNATYSYKACRWGFYVPYVPYAGRIQDIFALRDLYWKRYGPNEDAKDANGLLTTTWYCLTQFDGYLHGVEPDPVLSGVILKYGQYPQCTPTVPTMSDNSTVDEILNLGTGGTPLGNNPRGKVSVPAVFSNASKSMTYGVSLFKKNGLKYEHVSSRIGGKPGEGIDLGAIGGSGTRPVLEAIVFNDILLTDGKEVILIPWVTDAAVTEGDAGTLNVPAGGANFYGLNFDEKYKAYEKPSTDALIAKNFDITNVSFAETDPGTAPGKWSIRFTLQNNIADYPLTATINPSALLIKTSRYPTGKSCGFSFNGTQNNAVIGVYKPAGSPIISGAPSLSYHLTCTPTLAAGETVTGFELTILCVDDNNPVKLSTKQVLSQTGGFETRPPDITSTT